MREQPDSVEHALPKEVSPALSAYLGCSSLSHESAAAPSMSQWTTGAPALVIESVTVMLAALLGWRRRYQATVEDIRTRHVHKVEIYKRKM